ncbi:MAG: hypothetical protein HKO53_09720 [Gemmatimonadetes bacterium]|nr:hypothetical protein [Gemmatimonadota bacterium]
MRGSESRGEAQRRGAGSVARFQRAARTARRCGARSRRRAVAGIAGVALILAGCDSGPPRAAVLSAQESIDASTFAALIHRISEPGGYFDTDNLISNESGYLNVIDGLAGRGLSGGAYLGVGPDQNFSYVAELRPSIVFIIDVRRDNMLHHLLLKALVEMSPTRVEFLAHLHGVTPPAAPEEWRDASVEAVMAFGDSAGTEAQRTGLRARVRGLVEGYGVPLTADDFDTIERFHRTFRDAGPSLRFTSFGRAPRPYYPTYRQLVLETDADGDHASYLASAERYDVVRELQLAHRIIPVVGDLSGSHALREIGAVLTEMGEEVKAFYSSNVEYYLWQNRTFPSWVENVRSLPTAEDAVVIRSYFSNFGRLHPSAIRGYYATQSLQPVGTLTAGGFDNYWDVVTRDVLPLR